MSGTQKGVISVQYIVFQVGSHTKHGTRGEGKTMHWCNWDPNMNENSRASSCFACMSDYLKGIWFGTT